MVLGMTGFSFLFVPVCVVEPCRSAFSPFLPNIRYTVALLWVLFLLFGRNSCWESKRYGMPYDPWSPSQVFHATSARRTAERKKKTKTVTPRSENPRVHETITNPARHCGQQPPGRYLLPTCRWPFPSSQPSPPLPPPPPPLSHPCHNHTATDHPSDGGTCPTVLGASS